MTAHDGEGEPMTNEQTRPKSSWELRAEKAEAEVERLKAELAAKKFAPLGDNHHNAAACPYCSPKLASQPAPSGWQPHLTVADLRAEPEDSTSAIESHDVHFTTGDMSLLVNIQAGAGFSWALCSRDGKTDEHGSRNTDKEGAYLAPSGWQQRLAAMDPWVEQPREGQPLLYCVFCERWKLTKAHKGRHAPDCLWQNAKDALPPSSSEVASHVTIESWCCPDCLGVVDVVAGTKRRCPTCEGEDALPPVSEASAKPPGWDEAYAVLGDLTQPLDRRVERAYQILGESRVEADASPAKESRDGQ